MPPKLLVICGPTASGKTRLAVELALRHGGEVVSADSMQIYRGMDIGTAKPTAAEMQGVPHHMLDVADPREDYSVARYVEAASACVDDILARGKRPILAGGTGLYIDSLLAGLEFAPFTGGQRALLRARAQAEGLESLYAELRQVDPRRAAKLHANDEKRILRALEVYYETGETITDHDARTGAIPPRYEALTLALNYAERDWLRARIDLRVDEMLAQGLEGEVRTLLAGGVPPGATAMQAIGYKEFVDALDGRCTIEEAADLVRQSSRRYAKRQLTWFRRNKAIHWLIRDTGDTGREILENARRIVSDFDN